jgi:hypothetical protein
MKNSLKYGIYISLTLIGYFLIIDFLGYADRAYLSFFNAIITGGCIFLAIRDVYRKNKESFNYMDGFTAALLAGLFGTTVFTVFIAIMLFEVQPELVPELSKQIAIAGGNVEISILLFVFLSGVATTIVSALVILPIYKKSWNTKSIRTQQKPMNN